MTTLEASTSRSTRRSTRGAPAGADDRRAVVERMIQILNDGAINVLGSLGHQLGLFDTLASLPWSTSDQVADAAGLNERYVREWLGGVVTAGWVGVRRRQAGATGSVRSTRPS